MRVGLLTLGCDKNTVDNEYLGGLLEEHAAEVVYISDPELSEPFDAVVVTTCGFIGDAKEQSVDALVALAEGKREAGNPRRLFASGCLSQRYGTELLAEIPELDGLVGVGQYDDMVRMLCADNGARTGRVNDVPTVNICHEMRRKRSSARPYAYLKIGDGCNHACAFCAIPLMKGKLRSVPPRILLREAETLLEQGAKELVLIAQDVAMYGHDLGRDYRLTHLLRELCALPGDFWLRCLYCYPGGITDDLLRLMAEEPKIVPYLDVPLQHLDPQTLRRMNRPFRDIGTTELVARIRDYVPGISLRTTMIVGFPGETEEAHQRMLERMRELRFDWLGAFRYSPEEGTRAAEMPDAVPEDIAEARWHAAMETQAAITAERNRSRVGRRIRVLIDHRDGGGNGGKPVRWVARSAGEAPEIDGVVYVEDAPGLREGRFNEVVIAAADTYDLSGAPVRVD